MSTYKTPARSRREFLTKAGSGLGGLALASMLAKDGYAATLKDPLAPDGRISNRPRKR